ncbi:ATP-binding cassette domain-containing protein [Eubacterium sp. AF15-50]|uniref:ATP-binding cassette domain-containing protein n=1 Tax=Eubacterium sp. AF15-50 TaxID=2293103 RepID=UPI00267202DC|nr:ATP-binding cassette domain-containing protein [Eubacterium sp. AF15-50]
MEIVIENVSKSIHGVEVLKDINVKFEGGKIYGLRGKNGSGKTMIMRMISGLIRPSSGRVIIDGKMLGRDMSFPESIGVLIENPSFISGYTGYKNLKVLADIKGIIGDKQIKESIRKVGLNPEDKRKYRKYSLGMKQRLGIAAAIMEQPDIILLDEPINAIDENGVEQVRKILNELKDMNRVIIIACHDREELERLSDVIYDMAEGRLYSEK